MEKEEVSYLIKGGDVCLPISSSYTIEGATKRYNNLNPGFMHSLKLYRVVNGRGTKIFPVEKPKNLYQGKKIVDF